MTRRQALSRCLRLEYRTEVSIHKGTWARRTIAAHHRGGHRHPRAARHLVNNAGITIDKTVLKMSDDDWFKVLNVNLSGAFFLSQAALRHWPSAAAAAS